MDEASLNFHLEWTPKGDEGADGATWGRLEVSFGRHVVWGRSIAEPSSRGLEWTWLDLAEHLSREWPWLLWEEGWPLGIDVPDPTQITAWVDAHLSELTRRQAAVARRKWLDWKTSHNLASALHGAWGVPPIWLLREGSMCWIATTGAKLYLPFGAVVEKLENLVEQIIERTKQLTPEDPRSRDVTSLWDTRQSRSTSECVAIATGLPVSELEAVAHKTPIPEYFQAADEFQPNELTVVARMIGTNLGPQVLRRVLEFVRKFPRGSFTDELLELSSALQHEVSEPSTEPYEQGYSLARALREQLELAPTVRADPESLLKRWGVKVRYIDLGTGSTVLDGLAFWGERHGPAVIINTTGKHSQSSRGARATLAHELCHLLVDRSAGLPLADVRDFAPTLQEQRANAFAAEFLVPREVAGTAFVEGRANPQSVLRSLAQRLDVSFAIIAWQALNSEYRLDERVIRFLETKAPRRASAHRRYSARAEA